MAVPKKRTGHSAQGSRRAKWKATKPETTKCPNCGATVLAHTVCTQCGTYKGKPVRLADKAAVAAVKTAPAATPVVEAKKPAAKKPAAKKAATKKAETETKTTAKKPAAKKTTAKKTAKKAEKEKTEK